MTGVNDAYVFDDNTVLSIRNLILVLIMVIMIICYNNPVKCERLIDKAIGFVFINEEKAMNQGYIMNGIYEINTIIGNMKVSISNQYTISVDIKKRCYSVNIVFFNAYAQKYIFTPNKTFIFNFHTNECFILNNWTFYDAFHLDEYIRKIPNHSNIFYDHRDMCNIRVKSHIKTFYNIIHTDCFDNNQQCMYNKLRTLDTETNRESFYSIPIICNNPKFNYCSSSIQDLFFS